jgi:hypothetical protein
LFLNRKFIFPFQFQLSELGRPFTGGSWCGTASGHQLYFSETSTVTASVKVRVQQKGKKNLIVNVVIIA